MRTSAGARRVRQELTGRRGELVERSFARRYQTGGLRRTHLRGQQNILKRQLIHVGFQHDRGTLEVYTQWVLASEVFLLPSKAHEYRRWLDHTITYTKFKEEMWGYKLGPANRLSLCKLPVPPCYIMCLPVERARSRGRFTRPARDLLTDLDS